MSSTPQSAEPEFFVDRSLGAIVLPGALRQLGHSVQTMNGRYGHKAGEHVEDKDWIQDAGSTGLLILTKDDIRNVESQRDAMVAAGAKVFFLTNRHLRGEDQARWYVANVAGMLSRGGQPGPFMYGVYENRLVRMSLDPTPPPLPPGGQQQSMPVL